VWIEGVPALEEMLVLLSAVLGKTVMTLLLSLSLSLPPLIISTVI
jgi:hypothetical protein